METGRKETGRKKTGGKTTGAKEVEVGETGGKESRVKAMGVRETGGKASGGNAMGAQVNQETGGKRDRLMGERVIDNSLPGDKAVGQNVTEGIQRKSYCEVVRKRARVFVGDSVVLKTDRILNKEMTWWFACPGPK